MPSTRRNLLAASGASSPVLVEDVYQTKLRTGDGATPSIDVGLDMTVGNWFAWIKNRDQADGHVWTDTIRGATKTLDCNATGGEVTDPDTITSFDSDGYNLGADVKVNTLNEKYVDWLFKMQDGFFFEEQVVKAVGVTKTVDLSSLGTVGMAIVKSTSGSSGWYVWHRNMTAGKLMYFSGTNGETTDGSISVSGTTLSLVDAVIGDGTYMVWAYAHEQQIFGADGDASIVQCTTYAGSASQTAVNFGWGVQFIIIKSTSSGSWNIFDTARGIVTSGNDPSLLTDSSAAEVASVDVLDVTGTGITLTGGLAQTNASGQNYICLAIAAVV